MAQIENSNLYSPISPGGRAERTDAVAPETATKTGQPLSSLEIKAEGNFLMRNVRWLCYQLGFSANSSYDRSGLKTVLNNSYGINIQQKVMSFLAHEIPQDAKLYKRIPSQGVVEIPGDKISLSTVAKAREFAEFLKTSGLGDQELATSERALLQAEVRQWEAALATFNKFYPPKEGEDDFMTQRQLLETGLIEAQKNLDNSTVYQVCDTKTAMTRIKAAQKSVMKTLAEALKKAGTPTKSSAIQAVFKREQIALRNQQKWPVITASVKTTNASGQLVTNETTITPASKFMKIEEQQGDQRVSLGGICSGNNDNRDHAVNLAIDVLGVAISSTPSATSLLTVVRSGVDILPSKSEKISDDGTVSKRKTTEEEYETTFEKRFDEGLVACLQSKGQLTSITSKTPGASRENPIELDIADIGFLSQGNREECTMQTRQFEMLDTMHDQPREVTYKDSNGVEKKIWVKPKILAFNFGVEWGDRGVMGRRALPTFWKKKNEESLTVLLSKANNWVAKNSNHPDEMVVKRLNAQIKAMFEQGDLYRNGEDYYDVAARVILLSHKLGMTPKIHCKSGKDRTSRAIEAAKALAIEIQNSGDEKIVPDPAARVTPEQKALRQAVAFNSGNQTIQELNTGFRGNKQYSAFGFMDGLSYLGSKIAGYTTLAVTEYRGLSNFAKR